ncbi:UNVERIFIED_CONTAM: hypothetical protein FKN15_067183 [Acipenser sinensis]
MSLDRAHGHVTQSCLWSRRSTGAMVTSLNPASGHVAPPGPWSRRSILPLVTSLHRGHGHVAQSCLWSRRSTGAMVTSLNPASGHVAPPGPWSRRSILPLVTSLHRGHGHVAQSCLWSRVAGEGPLPTPTIKSLLTEVSAAYRAFKTDGTLVMSTDPRASGDECARAKIDKVPTKTLVSPRWFADRPGKQSKPADKCRPGARRGRSTGDLPRRAGQAHTLPGPAALTACTEGAGSHRVVRPSARRRQVPGQGGRGDSDRAQAVGPPRDLWSGRPPRLHATAVSESRGRRRAARDASNGQVPEPLPNPLPSPAALVPSMGPRRIRRATAGRLARENDGRMTEPVSPRPGRGGADARHGNRDPVAPERRAGPGRARKLGTERSKAHPSARAPMRHPGQRRVRGQPDIADEPGCGRLSRCEVPLMILPQVHLRKPCYDFYFL